MARLKRISRRAEQAARDGRSLADDPGLLDAFLHDVPPERADGLVRYLT